MTDLSVDAALIVEKPRHGAAMNRRVVAAAVMALAAGAVALGEAFGWRQAALFILGGGLGLSLYHSLFGFTSAWRIFIADRRGAGLRAQMLMLAVATLLMVPFIAQGSILGKEVHGELFPVGTSLLVGAFLFGFGMQLGGGCGSGTLYTAGGGNTRMMATLAAFIAGSVLGIYHFGWWVKTPDIGSISLIARLGVLPALALSLVAIGGIAALTILLERRRHGALQRVDMAGAHGWRRLLQGPWPLAAGAVVLAVGNFLTLTISGKPWIITPAFALWGSKIAMLFGVDPTTWFYWSSPARAAALQQSVFADVTSVMDFGIILGALLAAGLAGKFKPSWRVPARSLVAAVLGGLIMGYGARLAYGCNIGAYFSGIASASLHAWLWFGAAFGGSMLGTQLRPLFGLTVERSGASCDVAAPQAQPLLTGR